MVATILIGQAGLLFLQRTIESETTSTANGTDPLNMIFIVGFAVLIAVLAQRISRKGGRK